MFVSDPADIYLNRLRKARRMVESAQRGATIAALGLHSCTEHLQRLQAVIDELANLATGADELRRAGS